MLQVPSTWSPTCADSHLQYWNASLKSYLAIALVALILGIGILHLSKVADGHNSILEHSERIQTLVIPANHLSVDHAAVALQRDGHRCSLRKSVDGDSASPANSPLTYMLKVLVRLKLSSQYGCTVW